ncbi:hypothetical protein CQZ99_07310 [Pseudomonas poae]|uniref:DUF1120 domain-containing protein n=1 Tax=Pseudomonas poae TaxID=200451 RepID=A0A2S9EW48_9PSED|nr:hypothetical protein CQZ97_14065 [Pseudomonas poae]PRC20630.1 hypothetical protein CQZ99_07310 [Pseudomonas poae]
MPLLLGLVATAQAQDECQLNLSESTLDFGLMNRLAQRDSATERLLGERRLSVTLTCPHPQDMSLFYNALAASAGRLQFTEHGSYDMRASDGVLDGRAVELGLLPAFGQAPTSSANALSWRPGQGIAAVENGQVLTGKQLSLQLAVSAWADSAATQARDAVTWEVTGLFVTRQSGRSRELTLRARFAPVACTPHLSDGGIVDYGTLLAKDLSRDNENPLPAKTLLFSVNCDAAARFALIMHDNRNGSATGGIDETAYGLDLDNSQNRIGRYYVTIDPADFSADTFPTLYRTDSTTAGMAWSSASSRQIPIASNSYLGFTNSAGSTSGPVSIQNLTGTLRIKTYLAPLQTLDLRNVVYINGSGTIEIIYL